MLNVQNSGGTAAVIYNNEPGNFLGTMDTESASIIALSLSQEDGQFLVANKIGSTGDVYAHLEQPASGYEAWGGTSMATPHVADVAALIWSSDPDLTNVEIRDAMASTAYDLSDPGRDIIFGYGLVQAKNALDYLEKPPPGGSIHIEAIDKDFSKRGRNYTIYTTVEILDNRGLAVPGSTVYLSLALPNGDTFKDSSVTEADGTATFSTSSRSSGDYTAPVTDVTHNSLPYNSEADVEISETLTIQ